MTGGTDHQNSKRMRTSLIRKTIIVSEFGFARHGWLVRMSILIKDCGSRC